MNVERMQAARDASVVSGPRIPRAWLVIGAAAGLICAFRYPRLDRALSDFPAAGRFHDRRDDEAGQRRSATSRSRAPTGTDEVGGLARSLQVFKENAVTARRLEAEQRQQQVQKESRQHAVERAVHRGFRPAGVRGTGHAERRFDGDACHRRQHVGHGRGNQPTGHRRYNSFGRRPRPACAERWQPRPNSCTPRPTRSPVKVTQARRIR